MAILSMVTLRKLLLSQLLFDYSKGESDSKEEDKEQEAIDEAEPVGKIPAHMAEMMKQMAELKQWNKQQME